MIQVLKTAIAIQTIIFFFLMTVWLPTANAIMLGTNSADSELTTTLEHDDTIQAFLSQEMVQKKLVQMGVNPELAMARAASLTPAERALLEENIADLPAGAGVVGIVGTVFIVLLILELVGIIDIFKKF